MLTQIIARFRPPVFPDDDQTRQAKLLYIIVWILLSGLPLYFPLILLTATGTELILRLLSGFGLIIFLGSTLYLTRKGRFRLATTILLSFIWIALTVMIIFITGGTRTAAYSWYPILIVISALLLNRRSTMIFTLASVGFILIMLVLELVGKVSVMPDHPIFAAAVFGVGFIVLGVFIQIAINDIDRNLIRARRAESHLRTILETTTDQIFQIDRQHYITYVNHPDLTETLGTSVYNYIHPDFQSIAREAYDTAFEKRRPSHYTALAISMQGDHAWFSVTASPILNGDIINSVILIARDITDQRKLQEQQMQLELQSSRNQLLKDFVADITHNFRTPIAIMKTSLYLLQRELDVQQHSKRFETIDTQLSQLSNLVDDLMLLSKMSPGVQHDFHLVDVEAMLHQIVDAMTSMAQANTIEFKSNILPGLSLVYGYEDGLQQAIMNVIKNAIHYTPQGGTVTVSAYNEGDNVAVVIKDTGLGIKADDLTQIFERFYRGETTRHIAGTGLGLAILKQAIDLHHGAVTVESTVGVGTTFKLCFPVAQPAHSFDAS